MFAPLPEGALLREGRYEVLEVRTAERRLNAYLVQDTVPVRLCPGCRTEAADLDERFCSSCGAVLSDVEPVHVRYSAKESADERAFSSEAQLLEMDLDHPGLLLPRAFFVETPYGPPRRYLVGPEFSPPLATSLPVPQELNQVLEWGVQLAQALDYLHRHQITLGEIGLSSITADGKAACWVYLDTACVISPAARPQAVDYFAKDVRGLAEALLYLATGQQRLATGVPLPDHMATLFAQVLTGSGGLSATAFATALEVALAELRRSTSVTLVVGRRTDVGKERSVNEDGLLTLEIAPVLRSASLPVGLYVVADGMGGHEVGDVASRLAIEAVAQQAVAEVLAQATLGGPLPDARQWLAAAAQNANRVVHDQRKAAGTDMGTTLVMALLVGSTATVANVGDSRAYLLKDDSVEQITTDHSLVERLVATGQITPEEAVDHPQRNIIYRVIGDKPRVEVDLFEQLLAPGEALLLCSDGLSAMVPDERIWQVWRSSVSPQDACDRLAEAANDAGGEDNATVVIVQAAR